MATYNGHQEDSSGNILLSIGNGMTATLETGSTASQAYTKGAYIFFNNRLCKASTAISSGNTLAIGTNLTQTSIGAELTSHLRASNGDEFYFDYKDGKAGYYPTVSKTASEFVPFGGTLSETEIWGLASSSQTSAFLAQTVNLKSGYSLTDYSYIKIVGRLSTSDATEISVITTPSYLTGAVISGNTNGKCVALTGSIYSSSGGSRYSRFINSTSSTSVSFSTATQVGGTSSNTSRIIPISIKGLK